MKADLPDLRVRSGGYSSVDVSQHGIDKAYAVRRLAEILDVPVGGIVFVGDRMILTATIIQPSQPVPWA